MKQPEALRLAKQLEGWHWSSSLQDKAAAELRRLHEANQSMLEALKYMREVCPAIDQSGEDAHRFAIEAIAKGEQQ